MKKTAMLFAIGFCFFSGRINAFGICPDKSGYKLTAIQSTENINNTDPKVPKVSYETQKIDSILSSLGYGTPAKRKEFYESIKKEIRNLNHSYDIKSEEVDGPDFWKNDYGGPGHYIISDSKNEAFFHIIATPYLYWEHYYVVFSKPKDEWVIQKVIYAFSQYDKHDPELFEFKNRLFLSLVGSAGGTGVYTSRYDIYLFEDGNINKVLSYPGNRHCFIEQDYQTDSKTSPLKITFDKTDCYLQFTMTTDYFGLIPADASKTDDMDEMQQVPLFTKSYKFSYKWDGAKKELSIDKSTSSLHEDPFSAVYLSFDQNLSEFLKHFDADIDKVSKNPTSKQKIWLEKIGGFSKY